MRFIIEGPTTIHGTITVAGAKNEALKLFAAALLVDGPVRIDRVPAIEDIYRMAEVVSALGARVSASNDGYDVDAATVQTAELPPALIGKIRAGLVLLGPLLVRFGAATFPLPGGDAIGRRPIDLFIDGFRAFGATVEESFGAVAFHAGHLRPTHYVFPLVSVTGTEALMLLAVRVPGESILENVAMEPEVVALAKFLVSCGARIGGIGTPTLHITGVDKLSGGRIACIPDRIEAGTFAALVAACGGELEIRECDPEHLAVPLKLLVAMGATIEVDSTARAIRIHAKTPLRSISIKTHEYPGLATDLQPPFTVALTQSQGVALVHETIYEGRLFYVDKLNKMGANIILCDPHRCIVDGPRQLRGTSIESPDIRAGIALLIAAAAAHGRSIIENAYQIDRGFERIEERLRSVGVQILRE
ncbi:MAG: UDP-N-acetylglucosamine 1-carboxyvinyltransferase [Candidatus Uhrbacteria bacterium]